jgi:hypothetical protein
VASNASISGSVHDEGNAPVQVVVTISTQGLQRQTSTSNSGAFQFTDLKPGMYVVCAQPAKPSGAALMDTCLWQDNATMKIALAPGQVRGGVAVPLQHGYTLKVRVNDPHGLLTAAAGPIAGNALSLHIFGPSGVPQQIPITAQDASGRDHAIVIPYGVAHKVVVHSSMFELKDVSGNTVSQASPVAVTATQGGPSQDLTILVDSRKP